MEGLSFGSSEEWVLRIDPTGAKLPFWKEHFDAMAKDNEIECVACGGTGFPAVKQPAGEFIRRPVRNAVARAASEGPPSQTSA